MKVMMVAINCVISGQVSWQPTDKVLLIVLTEGLVEIFFLCCVRSARVGGCEDC
jgi:hypothetical protein